MVNNKKNINALSGLMWSFLDLFSRQGVTLLIQIVLARILLPSDFGLIGMTMVFIMLSHALVNSGFDQALIREDRIGTRELSTVFYFNITFSIIIYLIIYTSAPFIAEFYNEERITAIIRIMMLIVIINSLTIVQRVILTRQLNFKLQTKITIISSVISGVSAILLALNGAGVWSLVLQQVILQISISILLFLYVKWIPAFVFDYRIFKRYFRFGYKLLLAGFVDTLNQNIPNILLGRLFGATPLGYYEKAKSINNTFSASVAQATQRVMYPVMSAYKDDYNKLMKKHLNLLSIIMMIYFPIGILIVNIAPILIPFIFGEQWKPSIIIFQILMIHGLLYPIISLNLSIFKIINRTDVFLRLNIISFIFLIINMLVVLSFSSKLIILVLSFSLHQVLFYLITTIALNRIIGYSFVTGWKKLLKISVPSFLILVTGVGINNFLKQDEMMIVVIQVLSAVLIGLTLTLIFCRKEIDLLLKFLKYKTI